MNKKRGRKTPPELALATSSNPSAVWLSSSNPPKSVELQIKPAIAEIVIPPVAIELASETALDGAGTTMVDYLRQLSYFDPQCFNDPVHVIGVGASGSKTAKSLGKLGVTNLHLHDFDIVERHNLPSTIYRVMKDIGRPKVEAAAEIIYEATGTMPTIHFAKVDGKTPLSGYVFLMVDTMAARQEIWQGAIKLHANIKLMIETRMAINYGQIYAVNPISLERIKYWESTLFSDDEAPKKVCTNVAVGPMADVLAGLAIGMMIKDFRGENDKPTFLNDDGWQLTVSL